MRDLPSIFLAPLLSVSLLCATVGFAPPAVADTNATVAEALFSEGRRLLDEKNYEEACPKFAESQRLDPGTGTLLNLANCYELAGRTASAWATWKEAAASARDAGQQQREDLAREKTQALEGRLPKLTISLPPEAKVDGLVVKRDGEELPLAILGAPLPVDPKTHTLEASAPGYETYTTEVTVAEAESQTIDIPALVPIAEPPEEADPTGLSEVKDPDEPVEVDEGNPGKGQRLAGWITGGAGLVSIGIGAFAGVQALDKNEESFDYCDGNNTNACSQTGVDLREEARTAGTTSSIAIGLGAAAVVTGVVLILTAPKAKAQVAMIPTYDGGRVVVRGQF